MGRIRLRIRLTALLLAAALLISGCMGSPATQTFLPLPPPADGKLPLSFTLVTVGKDNQRMDLVSPNISVDYRESGNYIGGTASELVKLFPSQKTAVMQQVIWGDWREGKIKRVDYFDSSGELLGGMVGLEVEQASILQWLTAEFRYTVDRSRLYLVYTKTGGAERPQLTQIYYSENWGTTSSDKWAMGASALWNQRPGIVPESYTTWGFWESYDSPFQQATRALESARNSLQKYPPDFLSMDQDSARELIGRQTGFRLYRSGEAIGRIEFQFSNNWGRSPNTKLLENGALSRVIWTIGNKEYHLLVLTPELSPVPSTLYVFTDNRATADALASSSWTTLYGQLGKGYPGVIMAVHAIGDISKITDEKSVGDGKSVTVDIGSGGGLRFSSVGTPTNENVMLARNLLSLMGENGIKALGLYFPYKPGSGSGLDYYLATLSLVTAGNESLDVWGKDIGVLDRVGFPTGFPPDGR